MVGVEDAPAEETGVELGPRTKRSLEDRPTSGDLGFSISPLKFVVHASSYYAGRAADKIISLYSRACKLDRGYFADFNRSAGIVHASHGRWEKAIPLLEKALAMTPGDLDARMCLAEAYDAADQPDKAQVHLEKILEKNPNSASALRALGLICSHGEDYERAIECLEKAVEIDPDHAESSYRLGMAYDSKELYAQAVEALKKAIALDPRFAKGYQALGFTYESMGDRESAVKCFKKALEF